MDRLVGTLVLAFFLLHTATTGDAGGAAAPAPEERPVIEYVPASTIERYQDVDMTTPTVFANKTGEPFHLCADCRCCAVKGPRSCTTMKCCYRIVCDLLGKPFGVCAFQPGSCDCNNCQ